MVPFYTHNGSTRLQREYETQKRSYHHSPRGRILRTESGQYQRFVSFRIIEEPFHFVRPMMRVIRQVNRKKTIRGDGSKKRKKIYCEKRFLAAGSIQRVQMEERSEIKSYLRFLPPFLLMPFDPVFGIKGRFYLSVFPFTRDCSVIFFHFSWSRFRQTGTH